MTPVLIYILYLNQAHRYHQKTTKKAFRNPHITWISQDFLKHRDSTISSFVAYPAFRNDRNPAEYLKQFIALDLVQTIVDQTDLYAQRQIATEFPKPGTKHPPSVQWRPVKITNIKQCP